MRAERVAIDTEGLPVFRLDASAARNASMWRLPPLLHAAAVKVDPFAVQRCQLAKDWQTLKAWLG